MAKLIDTDGEVVAETTDYADLTQETEAAETESYEDAVSEAPVEEPEVDEAETDLPDKYQGKSAADIARMHQELEKRLGQQSSEVGELRQAFDEMVKNSIQAQQAPAPEVEEVDDIDFITNPKDAVRKSLQGLPEIQQLQAATAEMAKNSSLAKLQQAHPDMQDITTSSKFKEWVGGSKFREQLFRQADESYDFDAANELISLYKDTQGVVKQQAQMEKVAQKSAVKKASTGSSRSNPEGQTSRKIYRRTDLIELNRTNKARYEAMMPEIMKAYAEGRVK
jgi:DUF438 domain-containing protein